MVAPDCAPDEAPRPLQARHAEAVIAKLARLGELDEGDRRALSGLIGDTTWVAEGRSLIREGQAPEAVCALLDGWACRCKDFRDGRRQIIAILTPGDLIAVDEVAPPRKIDHAVLALTRVHVAWISRVELGAVLTERRRLARAIQAAGAVEDAILRAWLVNLGQRSAHARTAFLFCELAERLADDAGPAGHFALPLTQQTLAYALGLTPVHVNRVLRRLRDDGLVHFHDGVLTIHDPARLHDLAGFTDAYLRA